MSQPKKKRIEPLVGRKWLGVKGDGEGQEKERKGRLS